MSVFILLGWLFLLTKTFFTPRSIKTYPIFSPFWIFKNTTPTLSVFPFCDIIKFLNYVAFSFSTTPDSSSIHRWCPVGSSSLVCQMMSILHPYSLMTFSCFLFKFSDLRLRFLPNWMIILAAIIFSRSTFMEGVYSSSLNKSLRNTI